MVGENEIRICDAQTHADSQHKHKRARSLWQLGIEIGRVLNTVSTILASNRSSSRPVVGSYRCRDVILITWGEGRGKWLWMGEGGVEEENVFRGKWGGGKELKTEIIVFTGNFHVQEMRRRRRRSIGRGCSPNWFYNGTTWICVFNFSPSTSRMASFHRWRKMPSLCNIWRGVRGDGGSAQETRETWPPRKGRRDGWFGWISTLGSCNAFTIFFFSSSSCCPRRVFTAWFLEEQLFLFLYTVWPSRQILYMLISSITPWGT